MVSVLQAPISFQEINFIQSPLPNKLAMQEVLPFCSLMALHCVTTPPAVTRRNYRCGTREKLVYPGLSCL